MLKVTLVLVYIEIPAAMQAHDFLDGFACAAFASRLLRDIVRYLLNILHGVARTGAATACLHHRNVRKIVPEIHDFFRKKAVAGTEVRKVLHLCAGTEIYIFRPDSA